MHTQSPRHAMVDCYGCYVGHIWDPFGQTAYGITYMGPMWNPEARPIWVIRGAVKQCNVMVPCPRCWYNHRSNIDILRNRQPNLRPEMHGRISWKITSGCRIQWTPSREWTDSPPPPTPLSEFSGSAHGMQHLHVH